MLGPFFSKEPETMDEVERAIKPFESISTPYGYRLLVCETGTGLRSVRNSCPYQESGDVTV